jgi:hypothetical protein
MNIDQLEDDLRAALAARADEVPGGAAARVRAHHYRPRTRSLRPPVAVGGVTVAAATGAAVWLFALSPQTAPAFAGWTATPSTAAPGQVTTAESTCEDRVTNMPTGPTGPTPARGSAPKGSAPTGSAPKGSAPTGSAPTGSAPTGSAPSLAQLQPVLTDPRGSFTWVILASSDARTYASCISGPSLTAVSASGSRTPLSAPAGQVALSSSSQTRTPDGASYSFAEGRTGSGVTAATLVLADGTHVQATLQHGWFAAWWPSDQTVSSTLVTTASGTTTERLPNAGGGSCPQFPAGSHVSVCTSRSSGAGQAGHASGWSSGSVQSGSGGSAAATPGSGSATTGAGSGG